MSFVGTPIHQTQAFGAAPISPTPNQTQMFGGGSPTPNQTQMFSGSNPMAGPMQTGPVQTAQAPVSRKPYLAIMALAVVIVGAFIFKSVVPSSSSNERSDEQPQPQQAQAIPPPKTYSSSDNQATQGDPTQSGPSPTEQDRGVAPVGEASKGQIQDGDIQVVWTHRLGGGQQQGVLLNYSKRSVLLTIDSQSDDGHTYKWRLRRVQNYAPEENRRSDLGPTIESDSNGEMDISLMGETAYSIGADGPITLTATGSDEVHAVFDVDLKNKYDPNFSFPAWP
ncbi:MAG: hypothetical protein JST51_20545 [Armatimonadetes bacterium]|nr:hypothetical protein [Armatimonadota bacterium]